MISHFLDMELIINDMERKIGEVFECSGVKLRVEPEICMCKGCYFNCDCFKWCKQYKSIRGECQKSSRSDRGVIFKKVEDMEERTIKLTLEKAKEFYNKGSEFRDLALSAYTKKELTEIVLPKTWDEFCEMKKVQPGEAYYCFTTGDFVEYKYYNNRTKHSQQALPSLQDAKAHFALAQLHQLRDFYRQGWKPNYSDGVLKYFPCRDNEGSFTVSRCLCSHFLTFPTKKIAEEFTHNFKDLIIQAGDLL